MKDGRKRTGESLLRVLEVIRSERNELFESLAEDDLDVIGGVRFLNKLNQRVEGALVQMETKVPADDRWIRNQTPTDSPRKVLSKAVFREKVRKGFIRATTRGLGETLVLRPPDDDSGRWTIKARGKGGEAVILFSTENDLTEVFTALDRALLDLRNEPKRKAPILKDIESGWYDPLPDGAS